MWVLPEVSEIATISPLENEVVSSSSRKRRDPIDDVRVLESSNLIQGSRLAIPKSLHIFVRCIGTQLLDSEANFVAVNLVLVNGDYLPILR
jgi:hypothetical protein